MTQDMQSLKPTLNLRLRRWRERKGWTQQELADKIGTVPVNISRWEHGQLPTPYFRKKLCEIFDHSTPEELGWFVKSISSDDDRQESAEPRAAIAESQTSEQRPMLQASPPNSASILPSWQLHWPETLPNDTYYPLPEREKDLQRLLTYMQESQEVAIITIDGLGGQGKTAFAVELSRRALQQGLFEALLGDSAKQEMLSGNEIIPLNDAVLDYEALLDTMARQLDRWELLTANFEEKQTTLTQLLRQKRYLLLIDNLENVDNASTLVMRIKNLLGSSQSRAIVTSRKHVPYDLAHTHSLRGLTLDDSLFFLRQDIMSHHATHLLNTPSERLVTVHELTGGAPLALKLVIAQARILNLDIVLRQLEQATSNLYPYIFYQSWTQLSSVAQRLLLYIGQTAVTTVSWDELVGGEIASSEQQLVTAIQQVIDYSLLDVLPIAQHMRYGIHQLTRNFIRADLPAIWRQQGLL